MTKGLNEKKHITRNRAVWLCHTRSSSPGWFVPGLALSPYWNSTLKTAKSRIIGAGIGPTLVRSNWMPLRHFHPWEKTSVRPFVTSFDRKKVLLFVRVSAHKPIFVNVIARTSQLGIAAFTGPVDFETTTALQCFFPDNPWAGLTANDQIDGKALQGRLPCPTGLLVVPAVLTKASWEREAKNCVGKT